jgi:hypothetical protein
MLAKSPLASKTLWINGLTLAVSVLTAVAAPDVLPPSVAPYLVAALAVANLVLRFLTTKPIV